MGGLLDTFPDTYLPRDRSSGAFETIDYAHHEIHSGSHYYLQGYLELGDGDEYRIKMVTPDSTKWSHFVFKINSTGICASTLDEGCSGAMTGGTVITAINNNRNSDKTSGMVFTSGVSTATTYIIRLENTKWGADGFRATIGGGASRDDELILKQNTTYCRTFISSAGSNIVQFKASWYEHTDQA
jgi:hypothetical protein